MDVSIVIVNWNTRDILSGCLQSVYEQTNSLASEVTVIDNASSDGSVEMIKKEFPQVVLLENSHNRGFAAANNQGIVIAKGRYVLLLNSDTVMLDNAIAKAVSFADAHPEAAVIGCRVVNPNRTLQQTCFMFPSILNMLLSASYLYKLFPRSKFFGRERMTWWDRNDVKEVDVVTGCFMLVRREVIEEVGPLDERFFVYGEETDWCYRIKQAGWKILFTPDSEIIHLGGASSKQIKPEMILQLRASILMFFRKHKGRLSYAFACLLVSLFFFLRIPYWLAFAIFHKSAATTALQTARTYATGTIRALGGAQKLCFGRQGKSGADMKELDIICFGGEDWWYHNRGHIDMQLMRRFARVGTTLYINSIVMQKPKLTRWVGGGKSFMHKLVRKAKSIFSGLRKGDYGFWVYSPFSLPVHHIGCLRKLNEIVLRLQLWLVMRKLKMCSPIVWVACPVACNIAVNIKCAKLVYQRTDRFEEYPNVDTETIRQYDQKLKINADLTIFVSSTLYGEESSQCRKAIYLDHGVDFDMFASAENSKDIPDEMQDMNHPIVGFFGGIDGHTCDIELVENVTELLSEMSFAFVGNASADCSGLTSRNNVWMLGQKPYEQIPHYGKCFDVAIMPWQQNRWIEVCNPIKLKEYLALGKPVVSTPFTELQKYRDVVYEAKTPKEFADCIREALSEDGPELVAKRRQKVAQASWDSKAKLVLRELSAEKIFNSRVLIGDCTEKMMDLSSDNGKLQKCRQEISAELLDSGRS